MIFDFVWWVLEGGVLLESTFASLPMLISMLGHKCVNINLNRLDFEIITIVVVSIIFPFLTLGCIMLIVNLKNQCLATTSRLCAFAWDPTLSPPCANPLALWILEHDASQFVVRAHDVHTHVNEH